jgi:hypothetical protein
MVRLILILFCFFLATPAWGKIYKWVDEKGKTHFTDDLRRVPADQRPETSSQPVARTPQPSLKKESAEENKMKDKAVSSSAEKVINITIEECGKNIRQEKARSHLDTLLDTSQCKEKTIAKAVSSWKCETGPNQTKFCDNQLASFCSRKYTCIEETKNYSRAKFSEEEKLINAPSSFIE